MNEFNSDEVGKTLKIIVKILESNSIEYRFLGSVVMASINGKLHRNLGDLDLLVDKDKKKMDIIPPVECLLLPGNICRLIRWKILNCWVSGFFMVNGGGMGRS